MLRLIVGLLVAVVCCSSAEAHGFGRRAVVQRQVIRQKVVAQPAYAQAAVVQRVYAQPVVAQAVYAQPVVAQPVYTQQVVQPVTGCYGGGLQLRQSVGVGCQTMFGY